MSNESGFLFYWDVMHFVPLFQLSATDCCFLLYILQHNTSIDNILDICC
jgi:hypothetical protein